MLTKKDQYVIAVVGATGAVGQEMVEVLEERKFPVEELRLFASERTAGETLTFRDRSLTVKLLTKEAFSGVDIALFSAGEEVSREYAPMAASAGAVVIDNSAEWRMKPDVPLVVPEVNPDAAFRHHGIIANPNCSTIQMVVALKPLHDAARIKRIVVSSYQSVSGTGKEAMDELMDQSRSLLSFQEAVCHVYPFQIAFNLLPQIGSFDAQGNSSEEMKLVNETRKIMEDDTIRISATTVRVPVFRAHSESVNIETERKLSANEARALLATAPGVMVFDDPQRKVYPMPLEVSGTDEVYVGRIREDASVESGLNLWIVADNLRKGAALNAVQIAEKLIQAAL
ncbi:MAG TPA: aspartate-semialdehyde dehydrogenase [Nitrospiria bacterium]|jgi:aspartate-semialdehyde dehydrogenase|nr:aspartate-semialdehyde dehydrogenase [Nitrospiria bacterium]